MGFACGIVKDGKECIHESRRKALSCTRRLVQIEALNKLTAVKSVLNKMTNENGNLVEQIDVLTRENSAMTDSINAKAEEVHVLTKLITDLEEKISGLTPDEKMGEENA